MNIIYSANTYEITNYFEYQYRFDGATTSIALAFRGL